MTLEELITQLVAKLGISETQMRMLLAAPTDVVRGIVRDQRANPNERLGMIPERNLGPAVVSAKTNGWAKEQPIEMPLGETGQKLIEEMVNASLPHGVKPKR